jgi:excinuclease ABC subunit A
LVIEHNMDMIKAADYIVDLGPEGGMRGGRIICQGTPKEIISNTESITAQFLKNEIENHSIPGNLKVKGTLNNA